MRVFTMSPMRHWRDAGPFAAAAEAMRRILVEAARRKRSLKEGGDRRCTPLNEGEIAAPARSPDLLALDEALAKLELEDKRKAELVKLRYFVGLTFEEAAEVLGIAVPVCHLAVWGDGRDLGARLGERVEQRGLARVRQADDPDLERH